MNQIQPYKPYAEQQQQSKKKRSPDEMRFGPMIAQEMFSSFRSLASTLNLGPKERLILATIQAQVDTMPDKDEIRKKLTRAQTLRIAHFCNFDVDRSLKLMCRVKERHFNLRAATIKDQLATKTLFPCPGLETRDGSRVFMMRPSRYVPHETPVSAIIDNLIFVMDHMTQQDLVTEQKGLAFIANMDSWKLRNFSTDYCLKFMMALQGHVFPVKVNLFLIVNPPSWFGKVWAMMKPMLSSTFRKKVHMVRQGDLHIFLKDDFQQHLPDDIPGSAVNTDQLVHDYIVFHSELERSTTRQHS